MCPASSLIVSWSSALPRGQPGLAIALIVEGWGKEKALNCNDSGQETALHTEMDIWAFLFPESQAHLIRSSLLPLFMFIYTMKLQYLQHSWLTLLKLVWFSIPGSQSWLLLLWIHSATCLFASLNYPWQCSLPCPEALTLSFHLRICYRMARNLELNLKETSIL